VTPYLYAFVVLIVVSSAFSFAPLTCATMPPCVGCCSASPSLVSSGVCAASGRGASAKPPSAACWHFGAYLFAPRHRQQHPGQPTRSFLQIMVMLIMAYVGLAVGANKGDLLNLAALGGIFGGERSARKATRSSIPASLSTAASPTSPNRIPRRPHRHPSIRSARVATGGRFRRLAQTQSRSRGLDILQRLQKRHRPDPSSKTIFPASAKSI